MAFAYEIVTHDRSGHEHVRRSATEDALEPGAVLVLADRPWLIASVDGDRADAVPARYRLTLRHPDGREETGALRRWRPGAPGVGHQLATVDGGQPVSWAVVEQRLAREGAGQPFLELVAERDYGEAESLPDHELEHAVERDDDDETAAAIVARPAADEAMELVALEAGQAADWDAARAYIDALVIEEIGEDLLGLCGVRASRDPRETWIERVQERLRDDLARFRADVERDHDQIEEWDFRGGRIFAAVGRPEDEAEPDSGYGWMCRLIDADALGAAGFQRVRKALLVP